MTHMTHSDWTTSTVRRIGAKVKELRKGKFSAEGLAERVTELGYPYSRSALVNLEYGRKSSIDLGELLVLAAALEVPPMLLLYPDLADGPVEALPGVTTTSFRAAQWFGGEEPLVDGESGAAFESASAPLTLSRERSLRERQADFYLRQIPDTRPDLQLAVQRAHGTTEADRKRLTQEMRAAGMTVAEGEEEQ